jgi:hypothetical protein
MTTLNHSATFRPIAFSQHLKTFALEAFTLIDTLLNPRAIIAEVEQMQALHREANRVEGTDPSRAVALRQRASRIGRN